MTYQRVDFSGLDSWLALFLEHEKARIREMIQYHWFWFQTREASQGR